MGTTIASMAGLTMHAVAPPRDRSASNLSEPGLVRLRTRSEDAQRSVIRPDAAQPDCRRGARLLSAGPPARSRAGTGAAAGIRNCGGAGSGRFRPRCCLDASPLVTLGPSGSPGLVEPETGNFTGRDGRVPSCLRSVEPRVDVRPTDQDTRAFQHRRVRSPVRRLAPITTGVVALASLRVHQERLRRLPWHWPAAQDQRRPEGGGGPRSLPRRSTASQAMSFSADRGPRRASQVFGETSQDDLVLETLGLQGFKSVSLGAVVMHDSRATTRTCRRAAGI